MHFKIQIVRNETRCALIKPKQTPLVASSHLEQCMGPFAVCTMHIHSLAYKEAMLSIMCTFQLAFSLLITLTHGPKTKIDTTRMRTRTRTQTANRIAFYYIILSRKLCNHIQCYPHMYMHIVLNNGVFVISKPFPMWRELKQTICQRMHQPIHKHTYIDTLDEGARARTPTYKIFAKEQ